MSPRYFQALFDHSLDVILLADDQGLYVDANPAACEFTGYSREELLRLTVWNLTPESKREVGPESWQQFLSVGKLSGEYTILCKDGAERETEFRAVANVVPGIHLTAIRDITERRQTEAALRESEERFAKAFHASPIPIAITTVAEGRFVDVNDSLLRLYGYHRDEVIGHTTVELKLSENAGDRHELLQKLHDHGTLHNVKHAFRTKSGELRQGNTSMESVTLNGEPCILALTIDTTEHIRAEETLQQERDFISAVIDTVGNLVVVLDRQGRVVRFNRACEHLTGYSLDEVKGRNVMDIILAPEEEATVKDVLQDICSGRFPNTHENYWIARDGSRRLIAWANTALLDEADAVEYIICTGVDITERRSWEQELAASREQLRGLAARQDAVLEAERTHIAREIHDQMGQALSGLKMDLSWLSDQLSVVSEEEIHRKMAAMSKLIDTTIHSVREIATKLRPAMLDDLGLEPAIEWETQRFEERTGITCAFTAQAGNVTLSREQATAAFRILQEALTNVARHASATHVDVRLRQQDNDLILEIIDNGRGITQRRIADVRSLGFLGMQERAHQLGGEIRFTGQGLHDRGTTITLCLPLQN
ncbi:MAG TPA: PAS domain S-box protein [Abditibacteriaceae bacterium]|jgi:PAS domain S-box-containing protein